MLEWQAMRDRKAKIPESIEDIMSAAMKEFNQNDNLPKVWNMQKDETQMVRKKTDYPNTHETHGYQQGRNVR